MNHMFSIGILIYCNVLCACPDAPDDDESVREQVVDLLSGESVTLRDWAEAELAMKKLSRAELESVLREVVATAEPSTAANCATILIYEGFENLGQLLINHTVAWPEEYKQAVLGAIYNADRGAELRDVPRAMMQRLLTEVDFQVDPKARCISIDVAAILLGESSDPNDETLLQEAVTVFPQSPQLWLALHKRGLVGPDEQVIAIGLFLDEELPLLVRVAAAAAVASEVGVAREFVTTVFGQFIDEFADVSLDDMISQFQDGEREMFTRFHERQDILITLRIMEPAVARPLVIRALQARNSTIRVSSALVAAERWPEVLLESNRELFQEEEYENLLAFLTEHHPEAGTAAEERVSAERLAQARQRLKDSNVQTVFPFAGRLYNGL